MWANDAGVAVTDEQQEVLPTVAEWSADGAVMVELDWQGQGLRVQLEPEVTRSWTADILADRIMRLHRLALMRARAEQRMRIIEDTGAALPTTPGWPSLSDVDEYRRTIDF
jgi:DNA-binding protein YbaB